MISILIPSKNEPYLKQTIEDIERHAEGEIEILAQEDYGIGQRALTNRLAEKAKGEYLMKVDAHCSFAQGFDVEMMKDMDDKTVMAPYLMVLDAENWVVKPHKKSSMYVFDSNLIFQYGEENKEIVNETMCMQGSCFLVSKKAYFDWNLCDESLGSWGQQGVELGIKTWLNGGRCVTTKRTYYGHLFRHSETDFPYKRNQEEIDNTRNLFVKRFKNANLIPIIDKFNYPCDWSLEKLKDLST